MAKAGDSYQEIVGAVQRALDPNSRVDVGVWVDGPDGRRDMDVAVRGTKDGNALLTLIECKDWRVPVGIAVIDNLDSKRRDLGATAAVVFSNSGFTEDAQRKAARVGISLAAALKAGDPQVRVKVWKELIARTRSIDRWSVTLFPAEGVNGPNQSFSPYDVNHLGIPIVNWIADESRQLLVDASASAASFRISAEYKFTTTTTVEIRDESVDLKGVLVTLECSQGFSRQVVREDVSLGSYDFLTRGVVVPKKQAYSVGPFDREGWESCEGPTDSEPLQPGTFRIDVTLLRLVRVAAHSTPSELPAAVVSQSVTIA